MKGLFTAIGALLIGIALLTLMVRGVDVSACFRSPEAATPSATLTGTLWLRPKLLLGFVAIFLALGAEAGLFGLYRNYLEDPQIAGLTSHQSQRMFTVYFAVFACGRLVGSAVQKKIKPASTLVVGAIAALVLLGIIVTGKGALAVAAVTAIGFFVSIFFPTLYALAIEGLGEQTAKASGLLTMGFLGCAVLPVLQGWLADRPGLGLQHSYGLSFLAYLGVLAYAWKSWERRPETHQVP